MKKFKQRLLGALRSMLETPKELDKAVGICLNLPTNVYNYGSRLIVKLAPQWKKFSGDPIFPIPSSIPKLTPREQYYASQNLWEGEQLEFRKDFLRFLIKELEHLDEKTFKQISGEVG